MMSKSAKFEAGMKVRRAVLGAEYVDKAMAGVTDFSAPLQDLVTENAWGTVWTREGLSLRDRSLMTVAMLIALNRPHELRIHLRGALNNGLTREEIREIFLQAAVYCGMPAAVDAFRTAQELFQTLDGPGNS
jgi:4-carboxymuconolactone decarboxylase